MCALQQTGWYAMAYKNVKVIINPAAGKDEPILNTLETVFREQDMQWDVDITHEQGDGKRLARAAIAAGCDLIAAYGGDGTLMDVANGVVGSPVPLALLPGGTGNALIAKLGIPGTLKEAAQLIVESGQERILDVGYVEEADMYFVLRMDFGITGEMFQQATREQKDQYGIAAYVISALESWRTKHEVHYTLTIDGETIETEGMFCLVVNVGSILGDLDLSFAPIAQTDDGVLDVYVVKKNVASLDAIASLVFNQQVFAEVLQHWTGEEVRIDADPPQQSGIDGDDFQPTPLTCRAVREGLRVLVPASG
jgi:YegS/Rv2252/BmrU family lipid kinase